MVDHLWYNNYIQLMESILYVETLKTQWLTLAPKRLMKRLTSSSGRRKIFFRGYLSVLHFSKGICILFDHKPRFNDHVSLKKISKTQSMLLVKALMNQKQWRELKALRIRGFYLIIFLLTQVCKSNKRVHQRFLIVNFIKVHGKIKATIQSTENTTQVV